MSKPDLVVMGASVGGVQALMQLAGALPADFGAAVLVVQHIGRHRSILPSLLSTRGALPAAHAVDGEKLEPGRILVAPPDHHMTVEDTRLRLNRGPKEHHTRPAIDPLFRSAAVARRRMVVGVVLSGRLDDGTAGLQAIKACGGIAVVQDPNDAVEPDMPASALRYMPVDHCLPLAEIPSLLAMLVNTEIEDVPAARAPTGLEHELALSRNGEQYMEHLKAIGTPTGLACPDCQGGLWEVSGSRPPRFRCHTGHAYTLRTLRDAQQGAMDSAVWGAIRALQEKVDMLCRTAAWRHEEGDEAEARRLMTDAEEAQRHVSQLRGLVEGQQG